MLNSDAYVWNSGSMQSTVLGVDDDARSSRPTMGRDGYFSTCEMRRVYEEAVKDSDELLEEEAGELEDEDIAHTP